MIDIDDLIKNAIKSKNQAEIRAYKNLKAEIQTFKTAKNAKPYDEIIEIQIISKYIKKLESGISAFLDGDREDLAAEYRDERDVLKKLLPEPVSESEISSFIKNDKEFFDQFWVTVENDFPWWSDGTCMELQIPKKERGNAIKYLRSKFPTADSKTIMNVITDFFV